MKIIDEKKIQYVLEKTKDPSHETVLKILKKGLKKKGLNLDEVGILINLSDPALIKCLFKTASRIKNEIYGERIVFFAPLYVSDYCVNDCEYCNFHKSNKELKRRKLTFNDIEGQVKFLINSGHKRLLLEFGEDPENNNIDYVTDIINKIYSIKIEKGNIRRINVNIAATEAGDYRKLKKAKIGTYQLFQETYHKETYEKLHKGPKQDYNRQLNATKKAFEAGLDDLGLGVLFGLYDWRFEVLSLISHARYMDSVFGVGPHTISVPRFCPAPSVSYKPEYPVSDDDFLKLIAIIRIAVPYTGMIISTRESPLLRKTAFNIGISQASAGSVASPGGYGTKGKHPQFKINDQRSLHEVIGDILKDGLLPSFCTACYRLGRTGESFMDMAKPGEIHNFCRPNGLLTFAEYLEDFAKDGIYKNGHDIINLYLNKIEDADVRGKTQQRLEMIKSGQRDLYF